MSYYLANINSASANVMQGQQLSEGLMILNFIISELGSNGRYIPYYDRYDLVLTPGVEKYFIPRLTELSTITFFLNQVRYAMTYVGREHFWGDPRINAIRSLPGLYTTERTVGGMDVFVYFVPNQAFPAQIVGQFNFSEFTADTDLDPIAEKFYIQYLMYKLASRLCDFNNLPFSDQKNKTLASLENKIPEVSAMDMSSKKIGFFGQGYNLNLGDINIGRGYTP